ncbi:hypothetical protein RHGRI_005555 [Rhododendron griersonianum]|uniref:NAC domain-containing protein n=1 Tax=Rhododendron griersonianum TaxID=479676 RepID=A0AAV6LEZ0_9ERIC|nr:hypothetical protein RHGRI_005555 [Rhododendron griersonianum]
MNLPSDYRFRPTDKELLDYLKKKSKDEALPCDVVIQREIYGIGDKAPWQIFTDEDPWQICRTRDRKQNKLKTEGTIYVLTTLIKTHEKEIIRTAGCGSWNGGTALEQVVDMDKDDISVIGYKRMLRFQITNESGAINGSVEKGLWIMHEYSLHDGNTMTAGKGEYVLCRIKRDDSKNTQISPRKGKNVEAAPTVDDLIVPKPTKRVRTEFVYEQKMECDAAPETEVVPFSKKLHKSFLMITDKLNELKLDGLDEVPKSYKRVRTELVEEMKMDCHIVAAPETEVVPFCEELLVQEISKLKVSSHSRTITGIHFSNDLFLDQQKNNMSEHLPSIWW